MTLIEIYMTAVNNQGNLDLYDVSLLVLGIYLLLGIMITALEFGRHREAVNSRVVKTSERLLIHIIFVALTVFLWIWPMKR